MKTTITLLFSFCILIAVPTFSQQIKSHEHSISINYLQIKEGLNYGLVFRGPGLQYSYMHKWENEKRVMNYEAKFGFNYMETREIGSGNIHFVPLQLTYLYKCGAGKKIQIGPYLLADYNYALYPDLQSGYSFWFTNFSLGAAINYPFVINKDQFSVRLRTSLFGATSRPPVYRDQYFFDLSFGYAVDFLHSDFQFGGWNRYNVSDLEIRWQSKSTSRIALAYTIEYSGYYEEPKLDMLNQSLKIILLPKTKAK